MISERLGPIPAGRPTQWRADVRSAVIARLCPAHLERSCAALTTHYFGAVVGAAAGAEPPLVDPVPLWLVPVPVAPVAAGLVAVVFGADWIRVSVEVAVPAAGLAD